MRYTGPTVYIEPGDEMYPTVTDTMATLLIGGGTGTMLSFSDRDTLVRFIATWMSMDREWNRKPAEEFAAEPVEAGL